MIGSRKAACQAFDFCFANTINDSRAAHPSLGANEDLVREAREAVDDLLAELQQGWDEHDADITDRPLAMFCGVARLAHWPVAMSRCNEIHRRLKAKPPAGPSIAPRASLRIERPAQSADDPDRTSKMTPSLQIIFERVRRVPPGYVTTFGDLSPGAPRHAGRALSQVPPGVPWWRVVRSDGTWPKGDEQRARLLQEDVPIRGHRVVMAEARIPPEVIL